MWLQLIQKRGDDWVALMKTLNVFFVLFYIQFESLKINEKQYSTDIEATVTMG